MKLSNIRRIDRRINPETGRAVSVFRGRRRERGIDVLFYYRNGTRVFISDFDYSQWREGAS